MSYIGFGGSDRSLVRRSFTYYKQLPIAIFILLTLFGACSQQSSSAVGIEPSLGTPVTLFRDAPVLTSDLGVLGTVQVADQEDSDRENAASTVVNKNDGSAVWLAGMVVGLISLTAVTAARIKRSH